MSDKNASPPREDLFRAAAPDVEKIELRSAADSGPVMTGHFAVFNQWTEINSMWEGNFMERFAPGAFKKTFREGRSAMRSLFQHGHDPQVGDKPLGPISELREDDQGGFYEVPLLDASYVRDLVLPGLEAGLYGASFRFSVMREEIVEKPGASDHNPDGLPERTVKEARVREFGPVTFPAYAGATAGVRSMTDDFIMRCFAQNPEKLRAMFEHANDVEADVEQDPAPSSTDAAPQRTSAPERRDTASSHRPLALPTRTPRTGLTLTTERKATWPLR